MNINKSSPVLVTGANGYVASWVVKQLLDEGLTVHAAVRDPSNKNKVGHLEKLASASKGKLVLFSADLLKEGSYEEAMAGCELVYHMASPFVIRGIKDANKQLIDPALKGTRNVLASVNNTPSVKRVVLTSSVAAIFGDAKEAKRVGADGFTEEHWNTTSRIDHQPYDYSKLLAEKEAWLINKQQRRWDLVVLNPGLIFGPSFTLNSASTSLSIIREMANGGLSRGVPNVDLFMVDVRDVSTAHIKAGYTPSAKGRHILVSGTLPMLDVAKILKSQYPEFSFPTRELPKLLIWLLGSKTGMEREYIRKNVGYRLNFDNSYSKQDLGLSFRPIKKTLYEHLDQMIDDGILER